MSCVNGKEHSWGCWIEVGDAMFAKTGFRYESICQIFGCNARRYTEDLQPIGRQHETNNWIDWLIAYGEE